jgi:transcriptional regulator with XRE-family HTH domain
MANIRESLAKNIKEKRQELGITQSELAERAGISTNFIAMIETKKKFPAPETLERIAAALQIETHRLFSADPSLEAAFERLYQTVAHDIEQVVAEAVDKAISRRCKEISNKA